MLNLRKRSILAVLWLAATAAAGSAQTNGNPVAAARELYAAARYDEALTILNGLTPAENRSSSIDRCVCSRSGARRKRRARSRPW
jgi:hypothetical protein